jgi:hypothetical protein
VDLYSKADGAQRLGGSARLLLPIILYLKILIIFGASFAGATLPELPEFDMGTLLTVLGGMLGIGGLRTYEKQKGLTK